MRRLNILIMVSAGIWISGFWISAVDADIYSWTDEEGVTHFTNYAPPKHARLLMKTPEIPYDEEADIQRQETDRLEVARQELAEREAFLLQEQQEAERRLAEANARADAALREAEQILQDAEAAAENPDYNYRDGYAYGYGYYPYYRYGFRKHIHHYKYQKRKYAYPYYRHHRYGTPPRLRYIFEGSQRKHSVRARQGSFRGRRDSHRSRVAAFRGRYGLY